VPTPYYAAGTRSFCVRDVNIPSADVGRARCWSVSGDVDHYLQVMDRLSTQALTPAGTADFIQQIITQT
jgi:hypothetical protein